MPRRVDFCPWCGTGQHAGVNNPAHARPVAAAAAPYTVPVQHAAAPGMPAPEAAAPAAAQPAPASAAPAAAPASNKAASTPKPASAGRERKPVKLRWWLLLLVAVLGLWVWDKPRKIQARVDRALVLGAECKLNEAQAELIALRSSSASPEQLQLLQQGLNKASATCERKQERDKAWRATVSAVDNAIDNASFIRADQRLQVFVRKWGEDKDSRDLKEKITSARLAWQNSDAGKLEKEKADCRVRGGRWVAGSCW